MIPLCVGGSRELQGNIRYIALCRRQASDMKYAAYLGSCSANKELICRLLGLNFDNDFLLVGEEMAQQTFINKVIPTYVYVPLRIPAKSTAHRSRLTMSLQNCY